MGEGGGSIKKRKMLQKKMIESWMQRTCQIRQRKRPRSTSAGEKINVKEPFDRGHNQKSFFDKNTQKGREKEEGPGKRSGKKRKGGPV